jgi:hypothetical protein
MGAQSGDVGLQLKMLNVSMSREFVLESRSQIPHRVQQGWLTVATRLPCSQGEAVDEIAVDGVATSEAVLPPGVHEVRARFLTRYNEFNLDLVLDLRLADGACLRTPVISQSLPLQPPNRPMLSLSMDIAGDSDLSGLRAVASFQAGAAIWAGRFLLGGDVGAGMAMCNVNTCGRDGDNNLKSSFTVPAQADVSYRLGDLQRWMLFQTFLVGLRYSYFPVSLPTLDGDRRFSAHGGYVTFTWAFADPMSGALVHQEHRPLYQLVFPVGVLWEPGANKAAFTAGAALRFLVPL